MKELYYVEADGGVFLVEHAGKKMLPAVDEIPFAVDIKQKIQLNDALVYYCNPRDFTFDPAWINKDNIIGDKTIDSLVQKVVYKTKPNVFAGAVIPHFKKNNEVLLVLPSRGFSKNMWTLPGGFVGYAEHPDDAVIRETKEETGLSVVIQQILPAYARCCSDGGRFSIGFVYWCSPKEGNDTQHIDHGE